MYIEEALIDMLLDDATLTMLIGDRVYPEETPQEVDLRTQPSIIYQKISDIKSHSLTNKITLENPSFQFTCFAATKSVAREISEAVKRVFSDFTGVVGGIQIQAIYLNNELSGFNKTNDGTIKIYTEDIEIEVFYIRKE